MLYADVTPLSLFPSPCITCSHSNRWLHRASITTHARPAQGSPCCCLCQRSVVVDAPLLSTRTLWALCFLPCFSPSACSFFLLLLLLFLGLLRARAFAFGLSFCSFCFILFALVINVMNLLHAPPRPLPASLSPSSSSSCYLLLLPCTPVVLPVLLFLLQRYEAHTACTLQVLCSAFDTL